ncbi:uncharacterized membrane protein YgaE (UPF0421/DUF939 family) [Aequitasia blattaphilus]|uniref:Aromatic acid exporter family protein n=1 Tax=Aequitasia blattaphilus TaxID=2949332 RepID=A0ABT1E6N6_9FIRM|nr:aromatic acid exporter family protein [Aequitasia blattaphilus]MCP1101490.1 aromatic acid exporter family protein [Aequitasia blattaphilus]MCR8614130.1 aromatic acid exporter family protein [Aequitasia blattaphilus]
MQENKKEKVKFRKKVLLALKIAIGSFLAIYIAEAVELQFASSAGIITLLTIVTTKWETLKLSLFRVLTFLGATFLAWILFSNLEITWMAYGVYIFFIVLICWVTGLQSTISVNAVIGTHFLSSQDFSLTMVANEFSLVLIGITIAIAINLFHPNESQKCRIIEGMRHTEKQMQLILEELSKYLLKHPFGRNVWEDIRDLEVELAHFVEEAYEYQDNTFASHPDYYIHYFEMRTKQTNVLHNLHYEMKKIRNLPEEAEIIAEFILEIKEHVHEMVNPEALIEHLQQFFDEMHTQEPPKTMEEFDARAKLYHILMDLEEFLVFKKRFIDSLEDRHFKIYWDKNCDEESGQI